MIWRIEIKQKNGVFDPHRDSIQKSIEELGLTSITDVIVDRIFYLHGDLNETLVQKIADELLVDKITQDYTYTSNFISLNNTNDKEWKAIEISYNPGVMDPVEASTVKGIRDLGCQGVTSVRTAQKYYLKGKVSKQKLDLIINKVLSNKLIQHVVDYKQIEKNFMPVATDNKFELLLVELLKANDSKLKKISQEGQLFLNLDEMKTIQKHYKKLKRNPTDVELETIAQTWSEHCFHKTFRGNIRYQSVEGGKKKTTLIRNLLKSTIVKATKEINKSWCVSVFDDNAGVIKFDKDSHVCIKVETHNHPSALEPFGGANTGIGGVIRDILGTGLGAKPICNTDVFCFASPDMEFKDVPPGSLHPKRVMKGVVSGVRDYGNKMGIPTVNGSILFDEKFVGNPLVYCGSVGILPKDKVKKKVFKGDLVVVVGGKTGRDGIHGATFSSGELTDESEVVSSGAVQIGDPIQEKKVLDALLKARDKNLYTSITDCGAGGLSSAIGEMGQELGARIDLDKVPLKYDGLRYMEIWISESQERLVMSVSPKNVDKFLQVFADENVEATVIGEFVDSKQLGLFFHGCQVCDLSMEFLFEGTPRITKEAVWKTPRLSEPKIPLKTDLNVKLLEALSHYNVCSKEWVVRQYDHEVQGGSVIKPFVGRKNDGPSDAAVITPKLDSNKGLAISNGINVRFGMIDPFWMAASCIDEALRQIVSVGGDVSKIAILDNFCWGNPDKPDRLGSMVRASLGCYKAAVAYQTPFISGKDSLYNEYTQGKKSIAIPGTILISALGIIEDVSKTITMDFKGHDNLIYCVGQTYDELGGSIYLDTCGSLGKNVPIVNFKQGLKTFQALTGAVKKRLIASMHDCSEGGLAVALSEMAFSGGFGVSVRLDHVPYKGKTKRNDNILFSESNSRFLVEVDPKNQKKFEKQMGSVPHRCIGTTEKTPEFIVYGVKQDVCLNVYLKDLKEAWKAPLRF